MNSTAKFAGLDVSKATTAVAVAEGHAPPWYLGSIPNTPEAVRKLVKRLGESKELVVC